MKKRIFATALVLILMLSVVLTACGNKVETKDVKTDANTTFTYSLENTDTKETISGTGNFTEGSTETAKAYFSISAGHYNVTVTVPDAATGGNSPIAAATFDCPKSDAENGLTNVVVTYTASSKTVAVEIAK